MAKTRARHISSAEPGTKIANACFSSIENADEMKGTHHAWHDTSYYPHSAPDRSLAELGLQPWLGLWTFRRFGASSRHYHYPCTNGPHLKATKLGSYDMMKKIVLVGALVGALASCTATEQGTAIGAGTGAVIGGVVTNSWGGAAVGAVAGGLTGALIGHSVERRGYCIYRDRYGRRYEARC